MRATVVALALLESVQAFQAPASLRATSKGVSARMGEEDLSSDGFGGTLGVLPPLGLFDPLGLIETRDMRRYEIMEIKHGRAAMLGFLHVIHIEAGVRFEGYLSPTQDLKFADVPAGCFASLEAIPTLGWLQIMAFTCAGEIGYSATPWAIVKQEDDKIPGDIGGSAWVRYDDEGEKAYKLNVERQNGRGAMLGITGCLIHELLGAHNGSKRGLAWLRCLSVARAVGCGVGWGLGPLPIFCLRWRDSNAPNRLQPPYLPCVIPSFWYRRRRCALPRRRLRWRGAGAAHQQPQLLLGVPLVRLDANLGAQCKQTLDGCYVAGRASSRRLCVCPR